jgi:hypothetical protein
VLILNLISDSGFFLRTLHAAGKIYVSFLLPLSLSCWIQNRLVSENVCLFINQKGYPP